MTNLRDDFLRTLAQLRRSDKTIEAYHFGVTRFLAFLTSKGWTLETAPRTALADFAARLSGKDGLAPASVRLYVTSASRFLLWARQHGHAITEQVTPALPSLRRPLPMVLKEKTLAAYIRVAKTVPEPYRTALLVLPMCGLRVSELCKLQLSDIDVSPPWIRLRVDGKGGKERIVPVLREGAPLLGRYLTQVRPGLPGDTYLFPARDNRPITARMLQKHMRQVRAQLGLTTLTPHKLRHTYLTVLNEHGITGFDLAAIAGHSGLSTTQIYVHPSIERLSQRVGDIETRWTEESS